MDTVIESYLPFGFSPMIGGSTNWKVQIVLDDWQIARRRIITFVPNFYSPKIFRCQYLVLLLHSSEEGMGPGLQKHTETVLKI